MNEQELRTVIKRVANILRAIQQDVRAMRDQQERSEQDDDINPVWLDPILAAHQQAETAKATQDNRQYRIQNSLRWATWLAFIAAAIYAGISRYQLSEIQRQTAIAETGNRPWIKIVDVSIDVSRQSAQLPVLSFMPIQTTQGVKPTANLAMEVTIKNIGKGIARNLFIYPVLVFYKWNSTENMATEQTRICNRSATYNPGSPPFIWSTIFPDEIRKSRIMTAAIYSDDMFFHPTDRPGDWIAGTVFGCISYQSPRDYATSAVFTMMGDHDRFVEVGKQLDDPIRIHLMRDEHYEYAQ